MASLAELEKKLYEIESRNDAQLNEVVGVFSHADESFNPYTPKYRTNILLQNEKRQEADLAIDKRANSKKGLKLFILSVSFLFVFLLYNAIVTAYLTNIQTEVNLKNENIKKMNQSIETINAEIEYQKSMKKMNSYAEKNKLVYPDEDKIITIDE